MDQGRNAELTVEAEPGPQPGNNLVPARTKAREDALSDGPRPQRKAEPVSALPMRQQRGGEAPGAPHTGPWAGDALLRMGRSSRILAITVIVLLSSGLGVLISGPLKQSPAVAGILGSSTGLLGAFSFLMAVTVGYLVAKSRTTTRSQRRLIRQLLEEEAMERALRLNPITQFHHPEVCRDILLQQASHAARLHAPLSLLELTIADLGKRSQSLDTRPFTAELVRQIRRLCRSTDSLLRWTPDSFLLVLPEVSRDELAAISQRVRQELEQWLQERFDARSPSPVRWRGITSKNLDASRDILVETQRLLENETRVMPLRPQAGPSVTQRDKSIRLALELEIRGVDCLGSSFQEKVVTERVAADRVWFVSRRGLVEKSLLTIVGPDGSVQENAIVVRLIEREEEQLAEVQFAKTPAHWVVRA